MTLFHFHFFDGESLCPDQMGLELASIEDAYLEAVDGARAMWPDLLTARCNPLNCAFEITSGSGEVLMRLDFVELLDSSRGPAPHPVRPREVISCSIKDAHNRLSSARSELGASLSEASRTLAETRALLAKLSAVDNRSATK